MMAACEKIERVSGDDVDRAPLAERDGAILRAGPLSAVLEAGELRYVRFAGIEVVRRVFVAVRDTAWGSVPPRILRIGTSAVSREGFCADLEVEHGSPDADFAWAGEITGRCEEVCEGRLRATLRFAMSGTARRPFRTNRTGMCVLHPIEGCAGAACTVTETDGTLIAAMFPEQVAPHALFRDVRSLAYEVGVAKVTITFEGEAFETEDHRNWSDGSFKTYCRPLSRPLPYELEAGETVWQAVTMTVEGLVRSGGAGGDDARPCGIVSVGAPVGRVPSVGISLPSSGAVSASDAEWIRAAGFGHVRLELTGGRGGIERSLRDGLQSAQGVGLAAEIGLHLSSDPASELDQLAAAWSAQLPAPAVDRWVVYEIGRPVPSRAVVELARKWLAALTPGAPVGLGTIGSFAELNRDRDTWQAGEGLAFAINPQVHGTDDATIVESVEAPAWSVSTARAIAPDLPVWAGPVTFHRRTDPFAAGNEGRIAGDSIAPDPRLHGGLGAAWAVGCLAGVAKGGAAAVTVFEAAGPFGVIDAGEPQPVYHVLRAIAEFDRGELLSCEGSAPLSHAALAMRKGGQLRLVVANLQPRAFQLRILPGKAWRPVGHRGVVGGGIFAGDELSTGPYGVSVIDFSEHRA